VIRFGSLSPHTPARLAMLTALCLTLCSGCRDSAFVAELIGKQSSVDRDFGRAPEVWVAAATGDRFELGDGVRTGPGAEATLALPRRAKLQIKSDTVVRFKRGLDPSAPSEQLEVQRGELTIDTGELDLGVSTARGVVKITPATRVQMRAEPAKTRFDVVVGRVEYTRDGAAQSVSAGGGFDLEVGLASAEKAPPPFAATAPPNEAPAISAKTATARPAGGGTPLSQLSFQEAPPGAILTMPAGESAIIHDPAPPSDVRMTFDGCPELAVLELDRGNGRFDAVRARGSDAIDVRIPRGNFKYRLRCVRAGYVQNAAVSTGRLTVKTDAATRPLPLAPVTITADADGRRYTVSYQNRLPVITLRWPDAPPATAYRLRVQPDNGEPLSFESSRSSVTLESGRLGEGLHRFWFEAQAKQRSEQGLLQVSFDYTARTAYLTSPLEGEPTQGGRARFAGGTLIGSSVRLQGAPIKLDAQGRFSANIEVPAGSGGACVRVQHPSAGIHYYIRHLR
jgi:FecR protein